MYSTKQAIRDEAGFTYNTKILDANIELYQNQANGIINTAIGQTYILPLQSLNISSTKMLEGIERLLSAGFLLNKEYGIEGQDTNKDGQNKISQAYDMLDKIISSEVKLFDEQMIQLPINTLQHKATFSFPKAVFSKKNIY